MTAVLVLLGGSQRSRGRPVQLRRHLRLHLCVPRATSHALLAMLTMLAVLAGVLRHLVLAVRHHHAGLRSHRLVLLAMVLVRRRRSLLGNRRVLRLLAIVHGLLVHLRRRLAIDATMLVMAGRRGNRGGRVGLRCVIRHRRVWTRYLSGGHHVGGVYCWLLAQVHKHAVDCLLITHTGARARLCAAVMFWQADCALCGARRGRELKC